jgi:hypothetical protein
MSEAAPDLEAEARDALEATLIERDENPADLDKLQLYVYCSDLPADLDDDRAISLAGEVLANPPDTPEPAEEPSAGWLDADFTTLKPGVFPPGNTEYDGWMMHKGDKLPYAPWTDKNAPAPCSDHGTTTDKCDCSARFKWGWKQNRREFEAAKMTLDDPELEGVVFIQEESDPFVFVDGDDVRCPETGEVHPAFEAILCHLGLSYADISVSGSGAHVYYRGDLPEDETVAEWEIDTEPWGANEDLPAIEIYSGKHVCVATGDQIDGTPTEVRPWNAEVVWQLLEANDQFTQSFEIDTQGGSYEKKTDASGSEAGDCITAVNRLDARDVADKTIVKEWTSSNGSRRAFLPTWGKSDDGGTANFVDDFCWVDTGHNGGRGGPIEMALIDLNELRNQNSELGAATGGDFWVGYEHLRDLGFNLPEPPYYNDDTDASSDYYDAPLGDLVDGDPWSDPEACLEACLEARAKGMVEKDAEPPTLALQPIVRDLLGVDDIGSGTKEMATEVYLDEMTMGDFTDGQVTL